MSLHTYTVTPEARRRAAIVRFRKAYEIARLTEVGRISKIADEVCRKYGVSMTRLLSDARDSWITGIRRECWWRCRNETVASYPTIARFFRRDHSTIIKGCRIHAERMA